jgi:hypothetical protein
MHSTSTPIRLGNFLNANCRAQLQNSNLFIVNACACPFVIRNQITKNEELKKQERMDYLEEGRKVRQKQEEERRKVENIKKDKLDSLSKLGIEEKYKADLSKKKII